MALQVAFDEIYKALTCQSQPAFLFTNSGVGLDSHSLASACFDSINSLRCSSCGDPSMVFCKVPPDSAGQYSPVIRLHKGRVLERGRGTCFERPRCDRFHCLPPSNGACMPHDIFKLFFFPYTNQYIPGTCPA